MESPILTISKLSVAFRQEKSFSRVVDNLSLNIQEGEIVAIVGESGSGKSVTAGSITRLHNENRCAYQSGSIIFQGSSVLKMSRAELRNIRGNKISYIFQEPMRALNPLLKVNSQLMETAKEHNSEIDIEQLLISVGFKDTKRILKAYPFELSGGMQQRVMIAMALVSYPELIIADEPTTALDVTTQKKIIELLLEIQKKRNISILLITHNLSLLKGVANRIYVMNNGKIMESGKAENVLYKPKHPYTQKLIKAIPKLKTK